MKIHYGSVTRFGALLIVLALVAPPTAAAQIFQWSDESGNRHFTDNPNNVPEKYRARPPTPAPPLPSSTPPPPAKSLRAADAVREGARLSALEALQVEQRLAADPSDVTDRARLLGYYFSASIMTVGPAETIQGRRRHILWLIGNRPDAGVLGLSEATIDPGGHALADRQGYEQARRLWLEQVRLRPSDLAALRNAVKFFTLPDKETAERVLQQGQKAEPKNAAWGDQLAFLYALGVMAVNGLNKNGLPTSVDVAQETGPFARKARQALEASSRVSELLVAGRILTMYGSIVRGMRLTQQDYSVLAEQLLKKAETLGAPHQQVAAELAQLYEFRRQLNGGKDLPSRTTAPR